MDKDMSTILEYLNRPPSPGADGPNHRAWPTYEAYRRNKRPEQLSEDRWRMCYGRAYNLGVRVGLQPKLSQVASAHWASRGEIFHMCADGFKIRFTR